MLFLLFCGLLAGGVFLAAHTDPEQNRLWVVEEIELAISSFGWSEKEAAYEMGYKHPQHWSREKAQGLQALLRLMELPPEVLAVLWPRLVYKRMQMQARSLVKESA